MADDKRCGADGVDDGADRDDAGDDSVASGDGYDAALDPSGAQTVSGDLSGADADPAAAELSAIFAAALADEPPSRVTADSVLREVRSEKRSPQSGFGTWLVSGRAPAKWAGGLVAVAALVAAVIIVAPTTGSGPDSAVSAASGMYDSTAGAASASSAAAAGRIAAADGAGSAASAESAPESGQSEMSADSGSSPASAEGYSALSDAGDGVAADGREPSVAAAGPLASTGDSSSESAGATPPADDAAAQSSPGNPCALPDLPPAEWSAAVSTLPGDVTMTRLPGAGCQEGALRGNGIEVLRGGEQTGTLLWIVVSDRPIGRDGAATNSTVVSTSRGDRTVTVIANQSGDPWLDGGALQRLVDAVAAAGN